MPASASDTAGGAGRAGGADVLDQLVDAGVDASRLTARGAGPDEPVADNKTKAGKALNRRIEFKLLGAK